MADVNKHAYEFVMNFVSASEKYRDQYVGRWEEIIRNFMVQPDDMLEFKDTPYKRNTVYRSSQRKNRNNIILKDPETHKLVMTYAAKLVRAVFSDPKHEYVEAKPVGYEDTVKAATVTRLIRYGFSRPGTFRTFVEAVIDMILFGTSVVEVCWEYREQEMLVRSVESEYGVETFSEQRLMMPVYDDVKIIPLDITNFYPDPSRYRIQDMSGAAKRFRMNAMEARKKAAGQVYGKNAVETAIRHGSPSQSVKNRDPNFREGVDQPTPENITAFGEMTGYEYWGEVPGANGESKRRVVTILNNVVVRNDPFPYADPYLPFHAMTINPVQGRFYGISPAEVVRWDQSFADAIKILLAEAIIRQVHPPIAYDPNAEIDLAALKTWKADALIGARGGTGAIGTLHYDENVQAGFAMLGGLKESIQDASGARGAIQGDEGPNRESATSAAQRMQMAMDRPELAGMLLEQEPLPGIASAMLRRYQQFLNGTDELLLRVGESPESVWIGDIMGDFDISFMGSRLTASKQSKLQAFDRLIAYAQASPAFQMILPNMQIAQYVIAELMEMPEISAKVGDPQQTEQNVAAMQQLGPGGAGNNGVASSSQPAGMLPSQASGNRS